MADDFSRITFAPRKRFSAVLMQQGRVQLDADWNEQVAIQRRLERTTGRDVIGPCGVPLGGGGFALGAAGSDLSIAPGRIYVDGILVDFEPEPVPFTVIKDPSQTLAAVTIWTPDNRDFADGQQVVAYDEADASKPAQTFSVGAADPASGVLTLNPGGMGDTLSGFAMPRLHRSATYLTQPDYQAANPGADGIFLAYLDVWEYDVDALEDPAIREVALGGADSATRSKIVWQLKMWPVPVQRIEGGTRPIASAPNCLALVNSPQWKRFAQRVGCWLSARAQPTSAPSGPCILSPKAGYRRLENQLYRVEIHQGGKVGAATFKWSRDNGCVAASWLGQNGNDLAVSSLGRDEPLGFAAGQWVELTDVSRQLQGQPGVLVRLSGARMSAQGPILTVDPATATSLIDFSQFPRSPRVVRWDNDPSQVKTPGGDIAIVENQWLALESGVEVFFQSGGTYRTGDYWLIPARTATGDVEWPHDDATPPNLLPQSPHGVVHYYCHLGLTSFSAQDGKWTVLEDCRTSFAPAACQALHVTATNWANDDAFPSDRFQAEGLLISLDAPPNAASVTPDSAVVTAEQAGRSPVLIEGPVGISGNQISLRPGLPGLNLRLPTRVRVTLKGSVIWADFGGGLVYLDGQAFGSPDLRADKTTPRIALNLPTGNGNRAWDFESWFSLVAPLAVTITGLTLNPAALVAGGTSTATVTLSNPAATGGAVVTLTNGNPDSIQIPPNVTVPTGAASANFTVTALTNPATATITAAFGGTSASASLTVVGIQSITLTPNPVTAGRAAAATITLSSPALAGGAAIALGSSDARVVTPGGITIAAGATAGTATLRIAAGTASFAATITAALGPSRRSAVLNVTGLIG